MIKSIRSAFTLIELVVYMALLSVFSLMVFGFLSWAHQLLSKRVSLLTSGVSVAAALDVVRRDLMSGSANPTLWHGKACVMTKEFLDQRGSPTSVCVGWDLEKGRLRRIEGLYDFTHNRWGQRTFSTVAKGFKSFAMRPILSKDRSRIVSVLIDYELETDAKTVHQEVVRVRNRVLR